jgi:hypothetical protein
MELEPLKATREELEKVASALRVAPELLSPHPDPPIVKRTDYLALKACNPPVLRSKGSSRNSGGFARPMAETDSILSFIRSAFRSVWALELLLHLRRTRERAWSAEELVKAMRGSSLIVSQSLEGLVRAGLVSIDDHGCARYQPASAEGDQLVGGVQELYTRKPETVRRIIVSGSHPGLSSFADAFRLWKH